MRSTKYLVALAAVASSLATASTASAYPVCPTTSRTTQTQAVNVTWHYAPTQAPAIYSGHFTNKQLCTVANMELLPGDGEWILFDTFAKNDFLKYAGGDDGTPLDSMPNQGADWFGTDWTSSDTGSGTHVQHARIIVYIAPGFHPYLQAGVVCAYEGTISGAYGQPLTRTGLKRTTCTTY